jgi:hypothetical protein
LVGTTTTLQKATSHGESFHTIPITHGILKGGPFDGDPPNDEDGGPSHGGPWNNGTSKCFQNVLYPNWYVGPIAPTLHTIWKCLSYHIYKEGTNPDVHVSVFQKAINANGEKDNANINNLVLHNSQ